MAGKTSTFINNSPPSVDAAWLNLNQQEQNNLITGTGQSLSDAINNQQTISASRFAANNFYTDSGTADNYILILAGSFTNPVSSSVGYFEGMTIRFRPGNANTGGAAQVNVNGAGNKSLKEADGTTNPPAGVMTTSQDVEFRYDGSVFRRVTSGSPATTSSLGTVYISKPITISNNSSTPNTKIDFSVGNYNFDDGSGQTYYAGGTGDLSALFSASADGMRDAGGSVAINSPYYLFMVYNPTTDTSRPLASTSKTSPTMPSGFTKKRYITALMTDGSGNIKKGVWTFASNYLYQFDYDTQIGELNTTTLPTTRTALTVSAPENVFANLVISGQTDITNTAANYILFSNLNSPDSTPSSSNFTLSIFDTVSGTGNPNTVLQRTKTNSSRQVGYRCSLSTSNTLICNTAGWIEFL